MTAFKPRNPDYAKFVRGALAQQGFMCLLGAEVVSVEPGVVELGVDNRDEIAQQNGFLHGGVVGTLCDNAAAAAAGTLVPLGSGILTVEYKINFIGPAVGQRLVARGEVVRPGANVTVARADAYAHDGDEVRHVARALVTLSIAQIAQG